MGRKLIFRALAAHEGIACKGKMKRLFKLKFQSRSNVQITLLYRQIKHGAYDYDDDIAVVIVTVIAAVAVLACA